MEEKYKPFVTRCPHCGKQHDTTSPIQGSSKDRPADGDVTLCIACGEFGIFDHTAEGGARKMTDAEEIEIMSSSAIKNARLAWIKIMEVRK